MADQLLQQLEARVLEPKESSPTAVISLDDSALLLELDDDLDSDVTPSESAAAYLAPAEECTAKPQYQPQQLAPSLRAVVRQRYSAALAASKRAASKDPPELMLYIAACGALSAVLRFNHAVGESALVSSEWAAIHALAEDVFTAAEALKQAATAPTPPSPLHGSKPSHMPSVPGSSSKSQTQTTEMPSLGAAASTSVTAAGAAAAAAALPHRPSSPSRLSRTEIAVLARSSTINGRQYLPWCPETDPGDAARFPQGWDPGAAGSTFKFKDPHGLMQLSPAQKKHFARWMRIADIVHSSTGHKRPPVIVAAGGVSAARVRQRAVPDCSVIASLCITARYEESHKKRLISGIIYPQDAAGMPVYNSYGRYLVRLFFNGCFRRVEIDDLFPVDAQGRMLCAHSSDHREFWPSILEKAYLKMCNGGYNFPGSNSSIDMHAFTGWLPERFNLNDAQTLQEGRVWQRLQSAMATGDCLATLGTGKLSSADEERTGLVSGHAYAVLAVHEVPADTIGSAEPLKLVHVKNPWGRQVWRGRYSPHDSGSWSPALLSALGPGAGTQHKDDGTFFIDFQALCHAFERLYFAWSPALFRHRQVVHACWGRDAAGPIDDRYNVSHNPQFLLDVHVPKRTGEYTSALWLLLTRHVTQRDADEEEADTQQREGGSDASSAYLSLQLHDSGSFKQQMVLLPGQSAAAAESMWLSKYRTVFLSTPAVSSTAYSANPHILLRHDLPPGQHQMALVISQLKRTQNVDFTLRAWCLDKCSLKASPGKFSSKRTIHGHWHSTAEQKGTRVLRHDIAMSVPCNCSLFLELQAAQSDAVQFSIHRPEVASAMGTGSTVTAASDDTGVGHVLGDHSVAPGGAVAAATAEGELPGGASGTSPPPQVPADSPPLLASGAYRKCYSAKTVLALSPGSYTVQLRCLASDSSPRPFMFSCSMLSESAAVQFLVAGCSLESCRPMESISHS